MTCEERLTRYAYVDVHASISIEPEIGEQEEDEVDPLQQNEKLTKQARH